jgi:hypothetical protein
MMSTVSNPVTTIGTRYFAAIGSYSLHPITVQTWPAARKPCTRLSGAERSAGHGWRYGDVRDEHAEVLHAELTRAPYGHRIGGGRSFEADREEHDLLVRRSHRELQRVERRVHDTDRAAAGAHLLQVAIASWHAQHVAERGEDHVRAVGEDQRLVDLFEWRHAHGASGPVNHLDGIFHEFIEALLHDRVGLAAADFHERPAARRGTAHARGERMHDGGVAVFVEVLHASPPFPGAV